MRIRAAFSATLASAGILLAGWQSGAHVADTASTAAATSPATSSGSSPGAPSGAPAGPGASGGTAESAAQATWTYPSSVVQTRFGSVQVLRAEVVIKAQSAQVQTISGATVTSDAYLSSLQAALDAANL